MLTDEGPQMRAATVYAEVVSVMRDLLATARSKVTFWPLFILPLPVLFIFLADRLGWSWALSKYFYEVAAVPLIAAAALAWTVRAWGTKDKLAVLLACQAWVFTLRELHFAGTHKGVYIATALILIWAGWWAWGCRETLRNPQVDWLMISLVILTVCAYAESILIQRRWFRFVPREADLHIYLEECGENIAHLCFLVAALTRRKKTQESTHEQE